jgi:hypothetical protein
MTRRPPHDNDPDSLSSASNSSDSDDFDWGPGSSDDGSGWGSDSDQDAEFLAPAKGTATLTDSLGRSYSVKANLETLVGDRSQLQS